MSVRGWAQLPQLGPPSGLRRGRERRRQAEARASLSCEASAAASRMLRRRFRALEPETEVQAVSLISAFSLSAFAIF
jgi:hypothetical protein